MTVKATVVKKVLEVKEEVGQEVAEGEIEATKVISATDKLMVLNTSSKIGRAHV
jgi:hypothetical protein